MALEIDAWENLLKKVVSVEDETTTQQLMHVIRKAPWPEALAAEGFLDLIAKLFKENRANALRSLPPFTGYSKEGEFENEGFTITLKGKKLKSGGRIAKSVIQLHVTTASYKGKIWERPPKQPPKSETQKKAQGCAFFCAEFYGKVWLI